MSATLGRQLVSQVVTKFGLGHDAAEHVVAYVLEEVIADLERCRTSLKGIEEGTSCGVGTACARLSFAASRIHWTKRAQPSPL